MHFSRKLVVSCQNCSNLEENVIVTSVTIQIYHSFFFKVGWINASNRYFWNTYKLPGTIHSRKLP